MKCEICKAIKKLGLDESAHDVWVCADAKSPREILEKAHVAIHHRWHELSETMSARWEAAEYMPHQRAHYVTLGL
ncbi:MAG TPA: hypothetical protein VGN44_03245 [Candidatus Angelobacter sp.]|jgi:hypothetical protein